MPPRATIRLFGDSGKSTDFCHQSQEEWGRPVFGPPLRLRWRRLQSTAVAPPLPASLWWAFPYAPLLLGLAPHSRRNRVLELEPIARPTRHVGRTETLRHDTLKAHLAGMAEDHFVDLSRPHGAPYGRGGYRAQETNSGYGTSSRPSCTGFFHPQGAPRATPRRCREMP
jgi:hypothetical protein